ncbi:sugar phosphate isomerase/epimerase family protein [uncultured Cyclobacterium sp.]|uniref:sugar phosphate isomerase/epimerase family protein n=1 Tax=uncultured Cyclobacterium sp. TaxID=453820 RepID=UPI0030EE8C62|tara:strand:+ start:117579 stop:118475 length:897 start_codon:yes stop_codon:yes gene_type:complete
MKRRNFIIHATFSAAAMAGLSYPSLAKPQRDKMDRIGLTTVVFRNRFESTKPKNQVLEDELTLLRIPEYFVDRFNVHHVEMWTPHFESTSKNYLNELKRSLIKERCKLINLQSEGKFDPSDPLEKNRLKAVKEVKNWVDIAKSLQCEAVRVKAMKKSYSKAVLSLNEITKYAKSKGVAILIENHNDLFSDYKNHTNIIKEVPSDNLGLLADFGNYSSNPVMFDSLKHIAPFTRLVSAKTKDFSDQMEHMPYDFQKCIRIFETSGYQGIYSCEQWGKANPSYDYEKITDWMIENIKESI